MKCLIFCASLSSAMSAASDPNSRVQLQLSESARFLNVMVVNDSDTSYRLNRRFLIGPLERGADIEFEIVRQDGDEYRAAFIVEAAQLRPDDEVLLRPNQIVGRIVDKCHLAYMYSLEPGAYIISGKYSPEVEWRPFEKTAYISATADISIPPGCGESGGN